jgi:hypothetical protein
MATRRVRHRAQLCHLYPAFVHSKLYFNYMSGTIGSAFTTHTSLEYLCAGTPPALGGATHIIPHMLCS